MRAAAARSSAASGPCRRPADLSERARRGEACADRHLEELEHGGQLSGHPAGAPARAPAQDEVGRQEAGHRSGQRRDGPEPARERRGGRHRREQRDERGAGLHGHDVGHAHRGR